MSKINEAIEQMSVEEMKQRLASYMAADKEWAPKPVAIEVRHRDIKDISGTNIYDVIVLKDDDTEEVIHFEDRYSKLIYIYTLMHPKGYQRRSLNKPEKDFSELASLYRAVFMADPDRLIAYATKDFDHMMIHGRPRPPDSICYKGLRPHDEHGYLIHSCSYQEDDWM